MRRHLFTALLPLALTFAASAGFALDEGDRAPDFEARSVSGDAEIALHELRGKVVLVDFWASWCAPCNAAMPQLEKLSQEFPSDSFVVLGVNVDKKLEDARRALEDWTTASPMTAIDRMFVAILDANPGLRPRGGNPPRGFQDDLGFEFLQAAGERVHRRLHDDLDPGLGRIALQPGGWRQRRAHGKGGRKQNKTGSGLHAAIYSPEMNRP